MPTYLNDEDKEILVRLLRETIARDRFPLSSWIKSLEAVLAKLDPPKSTSGPDRRLKAPGEPSGAV